LRGALFVDRPLALRRSLLSIAALIVAACASAPAVAQDQSENSVETLEQEPLRPDEGRLITDLSELNEARYRDPVLEQRCEEEADAARIANEIIVCRDLGESSDGVWNKADWERRLAERTQGPKPIDVDGTGLRAPNGSRMAPLVTIRGCFAPPCPPEVALLIDVSEAPPGSAAFRIAEGLPPLVGGAGEVADVVRARQAELGLPAAVIVAEGDR